MPQFLSRLMMAAALAAGAGVSAPASAQSPAVADWQAPAQFLPPSSGAESPVAAMQCLALAISYEAGFEPLAGQEAVAQVILNRVRHRSYPDTVCGVVWQGSQRRTGCQFTFTCDGSLRRQRNTAALIAAQQVAVRVLAGQTEDHVRGATHYHANYVSPYWAPSLIRVRQIATHIFYRTPGAAPRGDGAPVILMLAASQPSSDERAAPPPDLPSADPAIKNGEYTPWGLGLGQMRR